MVVVVVVVVVESIFFESVKANFSSFSICSCFSISFICNSFNNFSVASFASLSLSDGINSFTGICLTALFTCFAYQSDDDDEEEEEEELGALLDNFNA